MPQQRKAPLYRSAGVFQLFELGHGGWAGTQTHVARCHHGAFHRYQRASTQLQHLLRQRVEGRVLKAGTAPEAGAVGVAQGAVIIHVSVGPGTQRCGVLPAQVVHAAAPLALFNAFLRCNAAEPSGFCGNQLGGTVIV